MQRQESWLGRPDNAMLARNWIHRFSLHSGISHMPQAMSTNEGDRFVNHTKQALALEGKQIHFVTYGNDVYAGAKKRIVKEVMETRWFASVKAWGPEELSIEFQEKYKGILLLKRGGGYWIWKFYVIEQTMRAMQEGDFHVYLDAGSQVNKSGEKRFFEYIKMMNESQYDILGFQLAFPEQRWTTPHLFNAFNVTEGQSDIRNTDQYEANTLMFQKGTHYQKWMKLCTEIISKDPWLITDRYNDEAKENNPEFKDNRHDQSIMSVSRKKLGCVRIDGLESKNAQPNKPFQVMRNQGEMPK